MERGREGEREKEGEGGRERDYRDDVAIRECLCVCVCARARARVCTLTDTHICAHLYTDRHTHLQSAGWPNAEGCRPDECEDDAPTRFAQTLEQRSGPGVCLCVCCVHESKV
jgi:hypothetical protein